MDKTNTTMTALNAAAEGYATKLTARVMTPLRDRVAKNPLMPPEILEAIETAVRQASDVSFCAG